MAGSDPAHGAPSLPEQLGAVLRHVAKALTTAGIADAGAEARRLVQMASGLAAIVVATEPERVLSARERDGVARFLARRLMREPLGRIVGSREFYGREFLLSPGTLEPRADTETLIDAVLEIAGREGWRDRPIEILDLGTGTGCILLTLLLELPSARGLGIDIAADAVETAEKNAARLQAGQRARFQVADGPHALTGRFDIVVLNPPYIRRADIVGLDREVRDFDPRAALDGGEDGLDFYRRWLPDAVRLASGGWVAVEIGAGQADDAARILEAAAGRRSGPAGRRDDLSGHTRVVLIKSQSTPCVE